MCRLMHGQRSAVQSSDVTQERARERSPQFGLDARRSLQAAATARGRLATAAPDSATDQRFRD